MIDYSMSFYHAPITNKVPSGEVNLTQLHHYIVNDETLRVNTELVRSTLLSGDAAEYRARKLRLLPSVTPAGVFSRAKATHLVYPNGLIPTDIDGLSGLEEAEQLRDTLAADPMLDVRLAFVSPSGRGVKLFVAYPFQTSVPLEAFYTGYMLFHWNYLKSAYDVEPDKACNDISRLCLLCHDSGAKLHLLDPTEIK
jgi:hypothetical protein